MLTFYNPVLLTNISCHAMYNSLKFRCGSSLLHTSSPQWRMQNIIIYQWTLKWPLGWANY